MTKKVLLFLAQGVEAYEASAFTDVFGWSREVGNQPVELVTTALREKVICTWNLIITPEIPFDTINPDAFDALAIPGGFESANFYDDAFNPQFLELIRSFDRAKKPIAAICVGALPLAKAGILNQKKATTYDGEGGRREQLAKYGALVVDQMIAVDGHIITSTGPSSSLPVAFTLLEQLTNSEHVERVKKAMNIKI